jgi:predicted kinase
MLVSRFELINTFNKLITPDVARSLEKKFFDELDSKKKSKFKCIYVCGCSGSGKSTFIQKTIIPQNPDYYFLSVDNIIEDIHSITGEDRISELYPNARIVSACFAEYLLQTGSSFVMEGTGRQLDILPFLNNLCETGFKIQMYFIKVPKDICIERTIRRNKITVRQVPIEMISEMYDQLWNTNFDLIKAFATEVFLINGVDNNNTEAICMENH